MRLEAHHLNETPTHPPETIRLILGGKEPRIWFVTPETTVFDAIAMMDEKGVGALLVMDGQRLAGIISERDYARKVILKGRSSRDSRVEEIMTARVITISPEQTSTEGMRLMTEFRVRHLPVVEGTTVIGIVSIGDLVRSVLSTQQQAIEHLNSYITGTYPA